MKQTYPAYHEFIAKKTQLSGNFGFEPLWIPDEAFDFQKAVIEKSIRKGRLLELEDCGLGKTIQYLAYAENVVRHTNKRVLILTPLAVAFQTVQEGEKFGITVKHRRESIKSSDKIVVTNYERLHRFDKNDFVCVICDESSILKNPEGFTKDAIIEFMRKMPYRLLATATAAPNDFIELGTSSEALGMLGYRDMLSRYFKKIDKTYTRRHENASGVYRFRGHSEERFWRWVVSWAVALRKPSDMGFSDEGFNLPELEINQHIVKTTTLPEGFLFPLPAVGRKEENNELKRTVKERCEKAAELHNNHIDSSVAWCYRNLEGELLEKLIPGSVNVYGRMKEEEKEEAFKNFANGSIKTLISKPTIAGFGLNWQHCAYTTYFPSHSYEQFYQSLRRLYRFGQKKKVVCDIVTTEGQSRILKNIQRKSEQAENMFDMLIKYFRNELNVERIDEYINPEKMPTWLN